MANEFDYAATVGWLWDTLATLEGWGNSANEIHTGISETWTEMRALDLPIDYWEQVDSACDGLLDKLNELQSAAEEASRLTFEYYSLIKSMPMAE